MHGRQLIPTPGWFERTGRLLLVVTLIGGLSYGAALPVEAGTATEEARLLPDSADSGFGRSVAIDGDTAVVGASVDDREATNAGAAYVYVFNGTTWVEQQILVASDAESDDFFGVSVAIDGDTIVVGADGEDGSPGDEAGAAYVFTRTSGVWSEQQKLTPPGRPPGATFGYSVALDGETTVIGADDAVSGLSGSAYVFVRSAAVWSLQQTLAAGDGAAGDLFGGSVAVSGDTAAVGAEGDDDDGSRSGSVYVFLRSGTAWSPQDKLTAGGDADAGDRFGYKISIDDDTVAIGSRDDDPGTCCNEHRRGAVYVFERTGTTWSESVKLGDAGGGFDAFGAAVAVNGDRLVVGAPGRSVSEAGSPTTMFVGSIFEFSRLDGDWFLMGETPSPSVATQEWFGTRAATSDSRLIVGAPGNDEAATNAGSAYVMLAAFAGDVVASGNEDSTAAWAPVIHDPGGGIPVCIIGDQPANGTASVQPDCSDGTYVPTADYNGPDSFTYVATFGARVDTAEVSIEVTSVDDAPIAGDLAIAGPEDYDKIGWFPSWTDPDGAFGMHSCSLASGPDHGTVFVHSSCNGEPSWYRPDADFSGSDSFEYSVSNDGGTSTATVTVTVEPENDDPTAGDIAISAIEGETITWYPDVHDIDGDPLECAIDTGPGAGTATVAPDCSSGTYVGPIGTHHFQYVASDGSTAVGKAYATVTVTVSRGTRQITILGGTSVVSPDVAVQLSSLGVAVSRLAGPNRYATAANAATTAFSSPIPAAFVATGENFPDALAGGPVAGRAGGPILLVRRDSIPSETLTTLDALDPAKVVILGGPAVVSEDVETQLRDRYGTVRRLAGTNRYGTAAAISQFGFPDHATAAYIATGENFPDALAGVPAAAVRGGPILLTRQAFLPPETIAELNRLKPDSIYILGGVSVVGFELEDQLSGLGFGPSVMRLAGSNRFSTAVTISNWTTWGLPRQVFVATGANFPDALAAGPIAGMEAGPILLVRTDSIPPETLEELKRLLE